MSGSTLWNALIRTHHITSVKKVAKLKQAAGENAVFVLLRTGGSPGIMYVEGAREGVERWVYTVQRLRYKDYQLASRPDIIRRESDTLAPDLVESGLFETTSVKDLAMQMEQRSVLHWWRVAMGYAEDAQRL